MVSSTALHQDRTDSGPPEPLNPGPGLHVGGDAPRPQTKARRRNRVIHSCLECRRRKMKCDRKEHCENCRTSGHQCVYVTSADADAQLSHKLNLIKEAKDAIDDSLLGTVQDHHCEPKVTGQRKKRSRPPRHVSSGDDVHSDGRDDDDNYDDDEEDEYLEPTPLAVQDAAYANDTDDDDDNGGAGDTDSLGFKIGRMRLTERIGGLYRPWIADELLSSLQIGTPQGSLPTPSVIVSAPAQDFLHHEPPTNAPSINTIFGHYFPQEPLTQYIPPRDIADRLLEQYWNAVHPIARVLHRPSFAQRYETLWEFIENDHRVTPSLVAVVCSVLFAACTSMSDEQVLATCHISKAEMNAGLKTGTETALGKADLLKTTKTETVQAFVAYMLTLCVDEISRAHSVLAGMVIRLAECMGLHRDPAEYGFSPAECQTRRLIWYQICYLDLKTNEIQGPRPFIHRNGYTTRLPLDMATSLIPDPSSLPRAWSDMVFSAIRFECQEMKRHCLVLRYQVDHKKLSLTKAISKIEAFRMEMEVKYSPVLNSATPNPMQRMASLVMKLFINLMYLILLHRYMNSVTYRIPDRLRQIVLTKGIEALEAAVKLDSSPDLRQWSWYSASYQNYHTAFLLLFEVFTFPMRREASRIWACLDWVFADVLVSVPPLDTTKVAPTVQQIVGYRDMKARHLLTTIAEGMRTYQRGKGLKLPVQFKPSMIVITPQKAGDSSDPRMPLNYAHGEPETEVGGPNTIGAPDSELPHNHSESEPRVHQPAFSSLENHGSNSIHDWSNSVQNAASYLASSSEPLPSQMHYAGSDYEGIDAAKLYPSHPGALGVSTTPNSSLATSQSAGAESNEIDQMPEIDWVLWDTMFPPQVNNGNLDISSDSWWSPNDALDL
ncbi:hypothetical protein BGZ63DRAFT_455200 [Mariannaea sp. PMI_226]|nr:hypothetical protein BGZ63DRAFT_455200 [Mariannaea sp. PMI_226]